MTKQAQKNVERINRFKPRAWIGYLVRYQSSNIFKIWNPVTNQVILTRDVVFNEDEIFPGKLGPLIDQLKKVTLEDIQETLQKALLPALGP